MSETVEGVELLAEQIKRLTELLQDMMSMRGSMLSDAMRARLTRLILYVHDTVGSDVLRADPRSFSKELAEHR